jgi:hypothetical protein
MTNGADKHDDRGGKKKPGGQKPKDDAKAKLKRKNLLPKALAGEKGK